MPVFPVVPLETPDALRYNALDFILIKKEEINYECFY